MEKKLLKFFVKKNCKKANKKEIRIEKVIQKKDGNYMLNRKDTITCLIAGQINKTQYK